ncbi:MAG TPA: LysR substrate-binding domain-containing protein [Usitatibacter sp.]|jgi:LysR family transcriptional activator for leuABCD operon
MFNLRAVDLNLLPVFEAAYEEKSLSRAAVRLAMTQPAVSHALSRLRSTFRDDLFVRHSRGMTPTPIADAIYGRLGDALGLVRAAVGESRGFDPRSSERNFTIAIPHPLGPLLAMSLIRAMGKAAPGITLSFSTRSRPVEMERGLVAGRIDLSVDWLPMRRDELEDEALFEDRIVFIARKGHASLKGTHTMKALVAKWKFVRLRPRINLDETPLEELRAWTHLNPAIALEVSELLEVLMVVSQSDLLGIVPWSLAERARPMLGVQVVPGIKRTAPIPVRMLWRTGSTADPAHQFLREQVRHAARDVIGA